LRIIKTARFQRAYDKLTDEDLLAVDRALRLFLENPRHPGLHFEKLKGSRYRTIRVTRGRLRIVLRGDGAEMDLVDIGNHDYVDGKYG